MNEHIHTLERLTMNALPAKEVLHIDDWYLRYTAGFTKRANSIYPLKQSDKSLEELIQLCEMWYETHKFPTVFKMTEASEPSELDSFLQQNNYAILDETSVLVLPYNNYDTEEDIDVKVVYTNHFDDLWFKHVCAFNQVEKRYIQVFKQLLLRIKARVCYAIVVDEDETILSCGLGVLEEGYFGLYDIVTNVKYRNQGVGRKLVHGLLQWGKDKGAHTAYLQVIKENAPARHLYDKIGFQEAYTYWYRVKK